MRALSALSNDLVLISLPFPIVLEKRRERHPETVPVYLSRPSLPGPVQLTSSLLVPTPSRPCLHALLLANVGETL